MQLGAKMKDMEQAKSQPIQSSNNLMLYSGKSSILMFSEILTILTIRHWNMEGLVSCMIEFDRLTCIEHLPH